jgi:hypothetical protein
MIMIDVEDIKESIVLSKIIAICFHILPLSSFIPFLTFLEGSYYKHSSDNKTALSNFGEAPKLPNSGQRS